MGIEGTLEIAPLPQNTSGITLMIPKIQPLENSLFFEDSLCSQAFQQKQLLKRSYFVAIGILRTKNENSKTGRSELRSGSTLTRRRVESAAACPLGEKPIGGIIDVKGM